MNLDLNDSRHTPQERVIKLCHYYNNCYLPQLHRIGFTVFPSYVDYFKNLNSQFSLCFTIFYLYIQVKNLKHWHYTIYQNYKSCDNVILQDFRNGLASQSSTQELLDCATITTFLMGNPMHCAILALFFLLQRLRFEQVLKLHLFSKAVSYFETLLSTFRSHLSLSVQYTNFDVFSSRV